MKTVQSARILSLAVLAALATFMPLAAAPVASGDEGRQSAKDDDGAPSRPTGEGAREVIEFIRQSAYYQAMKGLEYTDALRERLENLRDKIPYEYEVHVSTFLDQILQRGFTVWHGAASVRIVVEPSLPLGGTPVVAHYQEARRAPVTEVPLELEDLRDLNIRFVNHVELVHPLNRRIASYQVSDRPFAQVIEDLCSAAQNNEVAFDLSRAAHIRMTLRLHERTVRECLEMAAYAVGWRIGFRSPAAEYERDEASRRQLTPLVPRNSVVDWDWASEYFLMRDVYNLREGEERITTYADALEYVLLEHAVEWIRNQRLVVTVMPEPGDAE